MAEFQVIFREAHRMCSTYSGCTDGCPLYDEKNCRCMHRGFPDSGTKTDAEIERIVMKWAAEHPEPVYPSWEDAWNSLFPHAGDVPCPNQWFGEECPKVLDCSECLGRPMSREVAEKLGIKPVRGGEDA